jgi:hypothetical protein
MVRRGPRPRLITFNGKTQPLKAWAAELGLTPVGLTQRLERGWSIQRALTRPRDTRGRSQINATQVNIRFAPSELARLGVWIKRQQSPKPSRPEAVRRLVGQALDTEKS